MTKAQLVEEVTKVRRISSVGSKKTKHHFLSALEYMVILAIIKLGGNAYGVPIHGEICDQTGKDMAYGTIYKTLKGLANKGLIAPTKGDPTGKPGGKARTYYRVKDGGRVALNDFAQSVRRIQTSPSRFVPEPVAI